VVEEWDVHYLLLCQKDFVNELIVLFDRFFAFNNEHGLRSFKDKHPSRWIRYRARSDLIGSDGKIIITPHLITIHLISTMGCNFTQLSDPIRSDCRIRSNSNTMDPLVVPQPGSYEFQRIPTELPSDPIRSDYRF
jgi:hypothetical protein